MSAGVRKLLDLATFVAVFAACSGGLFALYKVMGISPSGYLAGAIVIIPAGLAAAAARRAVSKQLRSRYAPDEIAAVDLKESKR